MHTYIYIYIYIYILHYNSLKTTKYILTYLIASNCLQFSVTGNIRKLVNEYSESRCILYYIM